MFFLLLCWRLSYVLSDMTVESILVYYKPNINSIPLIVHQDPSYQGREQLLGNLPRITHLLILPNPNLTLSLIDHMLHKHFFRIFRFVASNPARIPQFTGNTQILAAAYQRIRFAAFSGCGDTVWVEVVLFAAGY